MAQSLNKRALKCLRNHSLVRTRQMIKDGWNVIEMGRNYMKWMKDGKIMIDIFCL